MTINVANILFTLSGVIGLYHSVRLIPKYYRRYVIVWKSTDFSAEDRIEALRIMSEFLIAECFRFTVHFPTVVLGIWSFWIVDMNNQPPQSTIRAIFGFLVLVFIIWVNIATTCNTINARHAFERQMEGSMRIYVMDRVVAAIVLRLSRLIGRLEEESGQ